jgi:glycosyltransferase involved in cell wall biosynthesis
MHIAHIVSSLEVAWGGPARVALELSGALARRGHTVELVAPADGGELFDSSAARAAGVRVNTFPIERPRFIKRSSPLRRHLLDILPQLDIVHLHSIYLHPTWLISRYAPQHSVPYIFAPHGALDPFVVHYRRYWL